MENDSSRSNDSPEKSKSPKPACGIHVKADVNINLMERLYEPQIRQNPSLNNSSSGIPHRDTQLRPKLIKRNNRGARYDFKNVDVAVHKRVEPSGDDNELQISYMNSVLQPRMHSSLQPALEKGNQLRRAELQRQQLLKKEGLNQSLVELGNKHNTIMHDTTINRQEQKPQTYLSEYKSHAISYTSFTASLNLDAHYLHEFRSGNFLYLRKKRGTELVMYDLEVVEHYEVDHSNYYTMSLEGITHFTKEYSEFWKLDKWELEYSRYMKMLGIRFFQIYKLWKNFKVWKQCIQSVKVYHAKKHLNEKLFYLIPSLQQPLLQLRQLCLNVATLELIYFEPKRIYTLEEFEAEQYQTRVKVTKQLTEFSQASLNVCVKACDDVVDGFLDSHKIKSDHKMTFMERAALRKECRTLTNFLRLVDFLTTDAMIQLTIQSFQKLYSALTQKTDTLLTRIAPPTTLASHTNSTTISQLPVSISSTPNKGGQINTSQQLKPQPLFTVIAKLHSENDSLHALPNHEQWVNALQSTLKFALKMVETPSKHLGHDLLASYTTVTVEDDGKSGFASAEQLNVALILNEDVKFSILTNDIFVALDEAFEDIDEYMNIFTPYYDLYLANEKQSAIFAEIFEHARIDAFSDAFDTYTAQAESFKQIPTSANVGIFLVNSSEFKTTLLPNPENCIAEIRKLIPILMKKGSSSLLELLNNLSPIAFSNPSTPEMFVKKVVHMNTVQTQLHELKAQYRRVYDMGILMDSKNWRVPDDLKEDIILMKEGVLSLEGTLIKFEGDVDTDIAKFSQIILDSLTPLNRQVLHLREKLQHPKLATLKTPIIEVLAYLKEQNDSLERITKEYELLKSYQIQLRQEVCELEELEGVIAELDLKVKLWNGLDDWHKITQKYSATPFAEINVTEINKHVVAFSKVAYQSQKALPGNEVADLLGNEVEKFKLVLPVITDLRSPNLQERHWNAIEKALGFNPFNYEQSKSRVYTPSGDSDRQNPSEIQAQSTQKPHNLNNQSIDSDAVLTLGKLVELDVMAFGEEISTISVSAQQEAVLQAMLSKVTDAWATQEFEVKPYKNDKDVYVLGAVDEIIAKLDDSIVTISAILGSRFINAIAESVDTWRRKLTLLQEVLDEWLLVQKSWMYLENIFAAPDIQRQLPEASKTFSHIDASWKSIMKRTWDNPHVLSTISFPGIKETFISHNAHLDKIQKNLEDYLETKRMAFPRFYFLSNDELLEILAQSKNPQAVQPHLRKCFENLVKLDFGDSPGSIDMLAMISSENEKVPLGKNLKARGNVEDWLKALEVSMKSSIYRLMKAGLADYDTKERSQWVCDHPGQVVATVAQMTWARGTEEVLYNMQNQSISLGGNIEKSLMKCWFDTVVHELNELIVKIRGDLTSLERKVIVALVTTDVHARDIVETLWTEQVDSVTSFIWQQQLRYYWDTVVDDVLIKHSDSIINYGYEYMGATSRLVITPLTDRCWMTLTGAYGLKLGAAPAGPAGTGKTESSKDLAKAMAIQCVVFNCSDQIDYKMMGKLFRGLAQAGNWTCLDEFNRIDIEVLSVVAQQLLILREGRLQSKEHINFMGIEILLKDHHVIVTMNPGYAGRTELPDNLKVCFRPVSMMVPDYALIAEIMLFAEGFSDARTLSRKMCKMYILCSEQLSQQPHYDYGLRAVKSVLVMAGSLKRAHPELDEDVTLIRALRDSNVPKFLADDLPLFHAIVLDLFPGTHIPENDYGELQKALEEQVYQAGLQCLPTFITKVIQLFDIFNVRFGGTLVGPTGTGKSTVYRMLQATMTSLRNEKKSSNSQFQVVHAKVLNPKCISMGELYGEFNEFTQEWHDGLASTIMRGAVADETPDIKWTVFDGPIDALWIENMNTVLDDNMTLCLANGERIKLRHEMRMLFEVMDLSAASPATVSRIGVVYLTPSDLGWEPYVNSWYESTVRKVLKLPEISLSRLKLNITAYMDLVLQYIRKNGSELVKTVDINLVTSFCKLFSISVHSQINIVEMIASTAVSASKNSDKVSWLASLNESAQIDLIDKLFWFSIIWALGSSITSDCHERFDNFVRDIMSSDSAPKNNGNVCSFPSSGLVFDFFVDLKDIKFKLWDEVVPKFTYTSSQPYFKMIVATPDTFRFTSILRLLIEAKTPSYVTGITGAGKTVVIQDLLRILMNGIENQNAEKSEVGEVGDGSQSNRNDNSNYLTTTINFSAQTSSLVTQSTIESKLEKKRKTLLGPVSGKTMILFVDDVNLPAVEQYGAQPPIELLRQFLDFGGLYDREKLFWKEIADTLCMVAAAPAGGGRSHCTPRFVRHFHVLSMYPARESSLKMIFSSILGGFMDVRKFAGPVKAMKDGIISAVIEIYNRITLELLPTPSKFHYTFNLRDVSKVFQGMLMISPSKCNETDIMNRLWIHESCRVFQDRLNCVADQIWYEDLICSLISRYFQSSWTRDTIFGGACPLTFCDYLKGTSGGSGTQSQYEYCSDLGKLARVLDDFLEGYNASSPTKMNLVFFRDAISHVTRLARILRQPRGNAMLIGVGGSGKQSITRLAAFIVDATCVQIEITRGYGLTEFREALKSMMISAGVEGKTIVFLFTDSQIVHESFLEDINNVLNSGEVPNLFPPDEMDRIINDMRPVVKNMGMHETRDNCINTFIDRTRNEMHIVLAMSPVGSALRVRCRAFPSLINCCSIDWYMEWPKEALQSVAYRLLAHIAMPTEELRSALVDMCTTVHMTANKVGEEFLAQLQRHVYTTPKSYLDLISLYIKMLQEKRKSIDTIKKRMEVGVQKLNETNSIVDSLKSELIALQPILTTKAKEAEELLKRVETDQIAAAAVKSRVLQDEAIVAKQAEEVAAVQADAQKDLDVAMPALNNAVKALDALSKNDITEVKSFAKPPQAVETVMNAVCLLLNEKMSWDTAKKLLADVTFLDRLKNFDKDNIPPNTLKKLKVCVADPSMAVEIVSKVSKAATSLCMWVHAMNVYSVVAKEVGPKRENLERMNEKLTAANTILAEKQEELRVVNENVAQLEEQCRNTLAEKDALAKEAAITEGRLERAGKLISGLSVEGARWKDSVTTLQASMTQLIGDIFLSSACISYYGPFTGAFRNKIIDLWVAEITALNIPCSLNYSLESNLGSAVEIREWQLKGLPSDPTSTDNAILVNRGERWPLMIDPQGQANKWIKNTYIEHGLEVTKMTHSNMLRSLETCIRNGKGLLIEDIEETLEPSIEPVLQKAIFRQGGRLLIHLGDSDIDYDPQFKLFLTTKWPNPHFLPEVYIKVTVINFTVTMDGLEDQLLGDAVRHERPDVEERKNTLVATMARDRKQLQEIEDRILRQLSESTGNVLDDQELINMLQSSNVTSKAIKERVLESEVTEKEINHAREEYRCVATRGSIIYFVVASLAMIDPMYQYSLPFFQRLFNICIDEAPKSDNLSTRLSSLINFQTKYIYVNICRGLFEAHKILFSVLICCKIMLHEEKISVHEWNLYLRGATQNKKAATNDDEINNPAPAQISEAQWALLRELEAVATRPNKREASLDSEVEDLSTYNLSGLCKSLSLNWSAWSGWLSDADFLCHPCPDGFNKKLNAFQKMLLVKSLAEEKVPQSIVAMIVDEMGGDFGKLKPTTMEEIYSDTDRTTPCIFVLSAGADPTGMLLRFAKDMGFNERLHLISLGQGQGSRAEKLIETSRRSGDWVLLQNCHLAKSWMPKLEKLVEELGTNPIVNESNTVSNDESVFATFRLFLTSFPASYFPVTVLQNGIKLTNEPPKGIRANLVRSFGTLINSDFMDSFAGLGYFEHSNGNSSADSIDRVSKSCVWKKLLIGLAFFHAVIQERRKFGPLGWNIKYEFNDTDLETSLESLKKFLLEQPTIPWDALRYVTGQINYGGRVTDDWDRRCLTAILNNFYTSKILQSEYKFSKSGIYRVPNGTATLGSKIDQLSYNDVVAYMQQLPGNDSPELFGMHENANVTYGRNESASMCRYILSLEPRDASGSSGRSSDQIVLDLAAAILNQLPAKMDLQEAGPTTFKTREIAGNIVMDSLATVLSQEVIKFNLLLDRMRSSLTDIQKAINGLIVMSSNLDDMYMAFLNNKVPQIWVNMSFASLKPLGSWVKDLLHRVIFFTTWLKNGEPVVFDLNAFFFPQGFMTGTLQNFARKYHTAIDSLAFLFYVVGDQDASIEATNEAFSHTLNHPEDGVYIQGLWLEGASWDSENNLLVDAKPGEMFAPMTILHFLPAANVKRNNKDYACPVYKTSLRQGTLSTTGISTNFVIAVYLPTKKDPNYWIMNGSAFLLNLNT